MRRQHGIGIVGLVFVLVIVAFVAIIGVKLVPVYIEYFSIKRALVNAARSPEARNGSAADLRKAFARRVEVDNIKAVAPADVDISKENGNPVLSVAYSSKIPLFGNINACIDFTASSAGN